MTDYKQKYKEERIFLIIVIIISFLLTVVFNLNIEKRDEEIWKLQAQVEDLKEQVYMLEKAKE